MGGRKGYSLKDVVPDVPELRPAKKELLQGIKANNRKKVVTATAKVVAMSDNALESLAHSFLFVGSIKEKAYTQLRKADTKKRRKEVAKRWAAYRKRTRKRFDSATNRDVVDSATRILGGAK